VRWQASLKQLGTKAVTSIDSQPAASAFVTPNPRPADTGQEVSETMFFKPTIHQGVNPYMKPNFEALVTLMFYGSAICTAICAVFFLLFLSGIDLIHPIFGN
jgi:hypothetical protein